MTDRNIPESPDSSAEARIAKLTEQWRLADIQAWNAEAERNDAVAKHAALVEALRDHADSLAESMCHLHVGDWEIMRARIEDIATILDEHGGEP